MKKTLIRTTFLKDKEEKEKKRTRKYVLEMTIFGYITYLIIFLVLVRSIK